jgi:Tfp pilus assembly protein PilF
MGRKARDKKARPVAPATIAADLPRSEASSPATPPRSPVPAPRPSAPQSRPPTPRRLRSRLLSPHALHAAIALLAVTFAVYTSGLHTPFLLDDPINIAKNQQIQRPLSLFALFTDPRAMVTLSLRWNFLTGGLAVTGYHVLNIVAHAATGWLVFALAWATLTLPVFGGRYVPDGNTGKAGKLTGEILAGVIALVFLLHPMQTESVTYVIQRAEIFVSAGLVAALLAFVAMKDGITTGSAAGLAAACVLGTYSKPSFAVLPALLLVYDLCFLTRGGDGERTGLATVARRWPAHLVAVVFALVTFALTRRSGSFEANTAGFDIEGIPPMTYLSAQFGVLVHYLRVALWPNDLCFDCGYRGPWPVLASPLGDSVVLPAAILTLLGVASLMAWKRYPLFPFAVFGSAVVLSPTSSFVPLADFYVEHRMYLPIALVAMALVPAIHDGLGALASRLGAAARARQMLTGIVAASVLAALTLATVARNQLLADPIALMEDALALAPQNERVQYNLANAYKRVGRIDDAIVHYEAAIRLLPHIVRSYENLGSLYLEQGKLDDALKVFLAGAAAKPDAGMAHRNVAVTYLKLGRAEEALAAAKTSLSVEPRSPNGHRLHGDALLQLGRKSEALEAWRAGLAVNPADSTLKARLAKAGAN